LRRPAFGGILETGGTRTAGAAARRSRPLEAQATTEARRPLAGVLGDYAALTKPRIIALLLVTCACAMVVARGGFPGPLRLVATLAGLALSSGGANAVNMWYDRDIDAVMSRTQSRPLPSGRLSPAAALAFGLACEVAALLVLGTLVNGLAALLALGGFVYYVGIYTMWLKRRTPQNIVIGGGAGAFPPLIGWAAVTGRLSVAAGLLFLIIFLWTPPHFWSLALYKDADYRRAGVPMMPVVRGWQATKGQSLVYAALLVAASLLLYRTHTVGAVYLAVAAALGLGFIAVSLRLCAEQAPAVTWAKRTFRYSLLYLAVLFCAMVVDVHR
jgi:protoheme IX farnesyltransferase